MDWKAFFRLTKWKIISTLVILAIIEGYIYFLSQTILVNCLGEGCEAAFSRSFIFDATFPEIIFYAIGAYVIVCLIAYLFRAKK